MASAGRILILPKGNYNAETKYEMLDLVFHNGTSWLAKKSALGIEPSDENSEHWFRMCSSTDLTEIIQRIAALESQMLGTISLEDIDLTPYAKKTDLSNYALKSEMNSINTSLDGRLDVIEPKVTSLTTDVNTAKTNITNLQTKVNGISTSATTEIKSYAGTGKSGVSNPCSVTFSIVPKVVIMLGWKQNDNNSQYGIQSTGADYCSDVIFCDGLTTSYTQWIGFLFSSSSTHPTKYAKKSSDGKTIYWYTEGDSTAQAQLNLATNTYYLLAIG